MKEEILKKKDWILKNELEKKNSKNISDLREKTQESQHILTREMKSNLMKSISVRLNEVISSRGKQIRIWTFIFVVF